MAASLVAVVLCRVAAAQDWAAIYESHASPDPRRSNNLPDGFEINETSNGSIPSTVVPSWDIFSGFSDKKKYIKGRMSIATIYPEEAAVFVTNPENMVDVSNFGSGSGDINVMSSLKIWDPKSGKTATTVSKTYVGEFSQSNFPYDLSCYPFDVKTVRFQIGLQKPCGIFYRLNSGCAGEGARQVRTWEDGTVRTCAWPVNSSYVGFDWEEFRCELHNNATSDCEMKGTRKWSTLLQTYLWPSIVYGLMGFQASALGVKLAMPRVATTMSASSSLTSLRNQVIALLPGSGSTSWMEEYFLIAISFMFSNSVGHAASFHLDAIGRHHTQKMVNKFNLWAMLCFFTSVVTARSHVRNCPVIEPAVTLTMTLSMVLVTSSVSIFSVWYHRSAFREAGRHLTHQMEEVLQKGPSGHQPHPDNV